MSNASGGRKPPKNPGQITAFSSMQGSNAPTAGQNNTSTGNDFPSYQSQGKKWALLITVILLLGAAATAGIYTSTLKRPVEDDPNLPPDPFANSSAPSFSPTEAEKVATLGPSPATRFPTSSTSPTSKSTMRPSSVTIKPTTSKPSRAATTAPSKKSTPLPSTGAPTKFPTNAPVPKTPEPTPLPGTPGFQPDIIFNPTEFLTPEIIAQFENAVDALKEIIIENRFPPTTISRLDASIQCFYPINREAFGDQQTIRDMLVYVTVLGVDGEGNSAARVMRCGNNQGRFAILEIDASDVAWLMDKEHPERMQKAIMHELIHAAGFENLGFEKDAAGNKLYPYNSYAQRKFEELGNEGRLTLDPTGSHWLNVPDLLAAVFNNEEISAITIEALRDKGWKVSLKNAESIKLQYGSFKVNFDLNENTLHPHTGRRLD